ncbi:hypothetical protein [Candidatus Poriferisodalis sp.]|uniref:hypothetical protein n=1 Tax=Candidatus Poriferisodalis sp. TaxID=3101277 RepID=UPI003B01D40B
MTAGFAVPTAAALAAVFAGSALAAAICWRLAGSRMRRPRWMRENARGKPIFGCSGLLVVAVGVGATALVAVMAYRSGTAGAAPARTSHSFANAGAIGAAAAGLALAVFGWLGYRDDTRGEGESGGFLAHIRRSWRRRRLTTGLHKAVGGGAAALLCVQAGLFGSTVALVPLLRGAAITALSANLLNLFDRAPGRATKVALVWWLIGLAPVAATWPTWQSPALWAAGAAGASVGLLGSEMREAHMQGDTGVNATGAVLGLASVAMASAAWEWLLLAVLSALNLASERWSFSRVIGAVPLLRWLDRLGSPCRI